MGSANSSVGDWRKQLRTNERRTKMVIAMFVAIYLAIGILVDTVICSHHYQVSVNYALYGLLHLQVFPLATVSMGIIAAISLLVTYTMHDTLMLLGTDFKEVTANSNIPEEKQLFNIIDELKVAAGLRYRPKIYIIDADYMNAFASGYSEKSAMVAITRGLMTKLDRSELQAVMAHELSHIRHHDIKLTLTASVLSNLILIVIDILFRVFIYSSSGRNSDRKGTNILFIVILVLRFVLPIVTVLLSLYLSRSREYMADAGSVELLRDNQPLGRALLKITNDYEANAVYYQDEYKNTAHEDVRRAAYIFDPAVFGLKSIKSIASMFSTHPDIRDRLRAIGYKVS